MGTTERILNMISDLRLNLVTYFKNFSRKPLLAQQEGSVFRQRLMQKEKGIKEVIYNDHIDEDGNFGVCKVKPLSHLYMIGNRICNIDLMENLATMGKDYLSDKVKNIQCNPHYFG